jgi:hypothetical protein
VGDDIRLVGAYFRLKGGQLEHNETCQYNVHRQITVIARESEGDIFAALQGNRYELRLLAVSKALVQLQEIAMQSKYPSQGTFASKKNKIYVDAGQSERLGAYINSARRVLEVRAACEEHAEIEEVLQLVFDGTRLSWREFYFEDKNDDYFRCHRQVSESPSIPIAIHGRIKEKREVKGSKNSLTVLNLFCPTRSTDYPAVLDKACFSVWSSDLDEFRTYSEGQDIVAFGLWKSHGIKEQRDKKSDRAFRNHELRLWPVIKSQLCVVNSWQKQSKIRAKTGVAKSERSRAGNIFS